MLAEPLALWLPLREPLLVQLVGAFVADHVSVLAAPVAIVVGEAVIDTAGGFEEVPLLTVTLVLALPDPPSLLQSRV